MKVKDLIAELTKLDPELYVCTFSDLGAMLVTEPSILLGNYEDPDNVKLVHKTVNGKFVALNGYADFDLEHERYDYAE